MDRELKRRLIRHLDYAIRIYTDRLRTLNIDDEGADEMLVALDEAGDILAQLRRTP